MLGNLIDNASKWANSRIEIQVKDKAGKLQVNVDDDGKGIDKTERARVLKRGVRADEQVPGTGLGLAITSDLARMYCGDLVLSKSSLGGLQATLILPVV
jgi:signal transduction histidine kinase